MIKVAVTDLEYKKASEIFKNAKGLECLCAPTPEDELANFIKDNDILHVIIGVDKYTNELYNALPKGGVIARFGVGHDGVNKELAASKGLYCTNTPGALDDSVAECAVGMILTAARHLASCAADNKNNIWKNRVGIELAGKTLAIIGCGNIGRKVAKIAQSGFRMKVVGCDLSEPAESQCIDEFTNDFATAVKNADFVSMHIPDIPATTDFINSERLNIMKSSAVIINTSRGGILDETAVYDAVESGIISGAVLDVFKTEPYVPGCSNKDLRKLDNIIMTPHIGSSTIEACNRMAENALRNIRLCEKSQINNMNIIPL
jgi:phosphoglycerate dehydrogenase-like enzyme